MAHIDSYLTFDGNCREAMTFYQACLGGNLTLQTLEESPLAAKMPNKMKDFILHASLTTEDLILLGSDMVPANGLIRGNSISLSLNCSSEEEIHDLQNKLSKDGLVNQPLEETFWGALFSDLTDKFGNHWLLNYTKK